MILSLLRIQAATACVASRDPEDVEVPQPALLIITTTTAPPGVTTTLIPPPPPTCTLCPLPIYRNGCNGELRSPCPSGTQANVRQRNAAGECIFAFRCPAGTQAFVWPDGRANPVPYSGRDLFCDGSSSYQWRTDMGLSIDSISCMGPVIPPVALNCFSCPDIATTYEDCTAYGMMVCYSAPDQISATIVRNGATCEFTVLCGPGTNFQYNVGGYPIDSGGTIGQMTCPVTGGPWVLTGPGLNLMTVTCMSDT